LVDHVVADASTKDRHCWIKRVQWRIPVWGPDGPLTEGEISTDQPGRAADL
jgi:hypothetical protein